MTHTLLVTGGAGYIGSHVVRLLLEQGNEVVVVDRALPKTGAVGALLNVAGDIRDAGLLDRIIQEHQFDAVVHFAAAKSVEESMAAPERYFDNNVRGSLVLLDAARRGGVGKFVFSSTCAVYGTPGEIPVTEDAPVRPQNAYGESKLMVERMLHWFSASHGLRYASLRYFNAAGATPEGELGEPPDTAESLLPRVIMAALGQRPVLRVFGTDYPTPDGTAIRDYVHVTDLAEAHGSALDYLAEGGPSVTLNLGTGHGSSVLEVAAAVESVCGRSIPIEYAPRRPGDVPALWADPAAARAALGWEARRALLQIADSAWRWHAAHPPSDAG